VSLQLVFVKAHALNYVFYGKRNYANANIQGINRDEYCTMLKIARANFSMLVRSFLPLAPTAQNTLEKSDLFQIGMPVYQFTPVRTSKYFYRHFKSYYSAKGTESWLLNHKHPIMVRTPDMSHCFSPSMLFLRCCFRAGIE